MWAAAVLAAASTAASLVHLSRSDAIQFMHRWRPLVVGDRLITTTGVQRYVRVRIGLEHEPDHSALVDDDLNFFLVHVRDASTTVLKDVVWNHPSQDDATRREALVRVRAWFETHLADGVVLGEALRDRDDRRHWHESRGTP